MTRPLVWLRADLRVRDNPALYHACAAATRGVVGVFSICPRQWQAHDWGPMKVDFLLRSLATLSESLARLGVPLCIVTVPDFAAVPAALAELAERYRCDALYFGREYEVFEQRRDRAVAERFRADGRAVHAFTDRVLCEPGELRTQDGRFYSVFTPFRRALYRRWAEQGVSEPLPLPKRQPEPVTAPDPVPSTVEGFEPTEADVVRPDLWKAGERHALRRLRAFADDRIAAYADCRDTPSVNGTSTLSPYLTLGVVSPRQALAAALGDGDPVPEGQGGPATWIGELVWREFYQHVLAGFPRVSMGRSFRREYDDLPWVEDAEHFAAWCAGRTGVPIIDAAMRQLATTGWMHNRCRMVVAMYLSKNLLLDWRLGERHFMRKLVDGDLGANNGGWQWSASTGTDAAPYFRIHNPVRQSERHDPAGHYIRKFVPELRGITAPAIHDPHARVERPDALDYPRPIVDLGATRERAIAVFKRFSARRST